MDTLTFQNKLLTQPWHGVGSRVRPLLCSILDRMRSARPDTDRGGSKLPKLTILGDVAVIPLRGILMIAVPDWAKESGWFNVTDANDIAEEIEQALNNPAVNLIVIDSDSPGGWSVAGDKLFELVESAGRRKPVFGWVADGADCCSSAYEAVAPCRAIYGGRQALAVGCIGSYLALLDDSEYWKQLGITWEVFRSGDLKGIGEDAITDRQREWLQSSADAAGETFRKNVRKYRSEIPEEEMQGQYYNGVMAAKLGFLAGTARDFESALGKMRTLI